MGGWICLGGVAKYGSVFLMAKVPNFAKGVWNMIENKAWNFKLPRVFHRKGRGSSFGNRQGKLPKTDASGNPIRYKEYDTKINPRLRGTGSNRGGHRIVRGSDGKGYYTNDHYKTFKEIE